jgi:hypothetical protein
MRGKAEPWASVSGSWDLLGEARYPYRIAGFIGIAGDGVLEFRTPFEKPLGLFVIPQEDIYLICSRSFRSCYYLRVTGQASPTGSS